MILLFTTHFGQAEMPLSNPDLALQLEANQPTLSLYQYVTFTLTIKNEGSAIATGVEVHWPSNGNLPFHDQTVSDGTFNHWDGRWILGTLPAGEQASIVLTLFTLSTDEIPVFAQVAFHNEVDVDSTPGNNTTNIPSEDDEALFILNEDSLDCTLVQAGISNITCDDQGTSDPNDDTFTFSLQPQGSQLSHSYQLSGSLTASNLAYDAPQEFGPIPITQGSLSLTIEDMEQNCTLTDVIVNPPVPCSGTGSCTIVTLDVDQLICDDAGTDLPDDDLFSFTIQPSGDQLGGRYDLEGALNQNFNSYADRLSIGPFLISDGVISLTATDTSGNCSLTETISPPNTCSGNLPCPNLVNLALNKPTSQSSVFVDGPYTGEAAKAVDGNRAGAFYSAPPAVASVAHTIYEKGAYWQVDLEDQSQIERIQIFNRSDGYHTTVNFYVLISDVPFGNTTLIDARSQSKFEYFVNGEAGRPTSIPAGIEGRYVRIQAANNGFIALAEVEVMGCDDGGNNGDGADLEVTMNTNQSTYKQWEYYSFTVTVANTGHESTDEVVLSFPPPDGMAFADAQESKGEYQPWGNYHWDIGTLDPGTQASMDISWFSLVAGPTLNVFTEVWSATGNDPDSSPGNGNGSTPQEDDEASIELTFQDPLGRKSATGEQFKSLVIGETYPNPTLDFTKITLLSKTSQSVQFKVYNSKGQLIKHLQEYCVEGPNQIQVNLSAYPAGVFTILAFPEQGMSAYTRIIKLSR